MPRRTLALAVAAAIASALATAPFAPAATRCVGVAPGCAPTLQEAIDAAQAGDAIRVPGGTYAGGVVITKSLSITGAGAAKTTIRGGGPVITVGTAGATTGPSVSLTGLTITGGRTTSSPVLPDWASGATAARGGGVFIAPGAGLKPVATVIIRDSTVTRNLSAPAAATTEGPRPACPGGPCPFGLAEGGGIDNWGTLTLVHDLVAGNRAGGPAASDADGAGVFSQGPLTVLRSRIRGNQAVAVPPDGRFAEGGGLMAQGGRLTVRDSTVDANRASLTTTFPSFVDKKLIDTQAHAGGIQVGDGVPTLIAGTRITRNAVVASGPQGEPTGFDAAVLINDSPLTMRDTVISQNSVTSVASTTADTGPQGSAIELDGGGTIVRTQIVGNTASSTAARGVATVSGGLAVYHFSDAAPRPLTVTDSVIAQNVGRATSRSGSAQGKGGGILNNALLSLHHVVVRDNTLRADAPAGALQGGGIWNGLLLSGPPVTLKAADSRVTGNTLRGSRGVTTRGAGVFAEKPVRFESTPVVRNHPDQCRGCGAQAARRAR